MLILYLINLLIFFFRNKLTVHYIVHHVAYIEEEKTDNAEWMSTSYSISNRIFFCFRSYISYRPVNFVKYTERIY